MSQKQVVNEVNTRMQSSNQRKASAKELRAEVSITPQRKTARYCKIPMKSKIVSFGFSCYIWFGFGCYIWFGFGCYIWFVFGCYIWILHLVVFTRFPANRDCLLKLYMLVKSARTVSRELHWGKHVYIGFTSWLTEGVVTILYFCAKLVFVLFIISLS